MEFTPAHMAMIKVYYKSFPGDKATLERLYKETIERMVENGGIIPPDCPDDIRQAVLAKQKKSEVREDKVDTPTISFNAPAPKEKKTKKSTI